MLWAPQLADANDNELKGGNSSCKNSFHNNFSCNHSSCNNSSCDYSFWDGVSCNSPSCDDYNALLDTSINLHEAENLNGVHQIIGNRNVHELFLFLSHQMLVSKSESETAMLKTKSDQRIKELEGMLAEANWEVVKFFGKGEYDDNHGKLNKKHSNADKVTSFIDSSKYDMNCSACYDSSKLPKDFGS